MSMREQTQRGGLMGLKELVAPSRLDQCDIPSLILKFLGVSVPVLVIQASLF